MYQGCSLIYFLRTEQSSIVLHWFQCKKPDLFMIEKTNGVKGIIATSKPYPHPTSWWPDPGTFDNHLKETKNEMQSPVSCRSPCMFLVCNKFKTKTKTKSHLWSSSSAGYTFAQVIPRELFFRSPLSKDTFSPIFTVVVFRGTGLCAEIRQTSI